MNLNEEFLFKYLNSFSPTGYEYQLGGQKIWMEQMSNFGQVELDDYGSAFATMGNLESDYSVVIEAHADEIAWTVSTIEKSGYIRVMANGGSDVSITPSMRVWIFTEKGEKIAGVFGHPPIHLGSDRKTSPDLSSIFIDVGATSDKQVREMGINVGDVITFQDELMKMGNFITGRALDNRIGGFMIAEVARKLQENGITLPYKLYVVNAVQEEIGLRGAQMIADRLKPNVAIITDVCHETTAPCYNQTKQGKKVAGEGGVIGRAPSIQNNLRQLIIDTAREKEIKHQFTTSGRSSGTDTDSFAYSNGGTPSALISIPLKYMHTTVETAHVEDIQSVIDMIYETLLRIVPNMSFKYNR